jgi:hypothetical protein
VDRSLADALSVRRERSDHMALVQLVPIPKKVLLVRRGDSSQK